MLKEIQATAGKEIAVGTFMAVIAPDKVVMHRDTAATAPAIAAMHREVDLVDMDIHMDPVGMVPVDMDPDMNMDPDPADIHTAPAVTTVNAGTIKKRRR